MPTKHDPLLGVANARVARADFKLALGHEGGNHHTALRMLTLFAVASASYGMVLSIFCHAYHRIPLFSLAFTMWVALAGWMLSQTLKDSERWKRWMGSFVTVPAGLAALVGLRIYYRELVYYQYYSEAKVYTNVPASQPAALFADAGMLGFSADSRLDGSRAVGYRSARLGATLCVAPVVDGSSAASGGAGAEVSLYAAGIGCCDYRANFRCDDAVDALASSALLHPPPDALAGRLMSWVVEDPFETEGFKRAVELQSAVYGTAHAAKVRLLRWSRDPRRLRDAFLDRALAWLGSAIAVFEVGALVASALVALGPRRLRRLVGNAEYAAERALHVHAFSKKLPTAGTP